MCMFKNRPLALAFLCFALISIFAYGLSFWETLGIARKGAHFTRVHGVYHAAKIGFLGNFVERRHVRPHIVDDSEVYGNILFLQLSRLF